MKKFFTFGLFSFLVAELLAAQTTYNVTTNSDTGPGSLRTALEQMMTTNVNSDVVIHFSPGLGPIQLQSHLPIVAMNSLAAGPGTVTINGNGNTIDGNNFQAFFVTPIFNYGTGYGTTAAAIDVTISDLTIQNAKALGGQGGNGGVDQGLSTFGGGGSLAAGAALFVDQGATVTISNVSFSSCNATGGNGGSGAGSAFSGSGGGAGFLGKGGDGYLDSSNFTGGGGGGGGFRSSGGDAVFGSSGGSAPAGSGSGGGGGGNWLSGSTSSNGGSGAVDGGGGGGGGTGFNGSTGTSVGGVGGNNLAGSGSGASNLPGSDGGGGGGGDPSTPGGAGSFGGGGGGAGSSSESGFNSLGFGGTGGGYDQFGNLGGDFGGGGGDNLGYGGSSGGFGGGGGGLFGTGGFGGGGGGAGLGGTISGIGGGDGGDGTNGVGGGGGAGLGGAIFVRQGGILKVDSTIALNSNTVLAGNGTDGGLPGSAQGEDLFLHSSSNVLFTITGSSAQSNGSISGFGSITKSGSGSLTLGGSNTYSGTTTVNNGTLVLGSNSSAGGAMTVNGGTLTINGAITSSTVITVNNGTFNVNGSIGSTNAIALNSGDLSVNGSIGSATQISLNGGTLTVNGSIGASTATTVNSGTLEVNGSMITDSTIIKPSGLLKGIGTLQSPVQLQNGATIWANNPAGTLTVGPLTLNSASATIIEVGPTSSAKIAVNGEVLLKGALQVIQTPGVYTDSTYSILTFTDRMHSTFNSISLPPYFTLVYGDTFVNLVFSSAIPTLSCLNENNKILLNRLNAIRDDRSIADAINDLLLLSCSALDDALSSISPLRLASETLASMNVQFAFSDLIRTHLSEWKQVRKHSFGNEAHSSLQKRNLTASNSDKIHHKPGNSKNYSFWANGFGQFAHQKEEESNPAFDATTGAVFVGFDQAFLSGDFKAIFGGGGGYAHNWITHAQNFGHASANMYVGSLYGEIFNPHFHLDAELLSSYNLIENQRHVIVPTSYVYGGTDKRVDSNSHSWSVTPHLGLGFNIHTWWMTFEPFATLDWSLNWASPIDESASDYALKMHVEKHASSLLRSQVGLGFYEEWQNENSFFYIRETVAYVRKTPYSIGQVTAGIIGFPGSFTLETFTSSQNLIAPTFELFYKHKTGAYGSLTYQGEFGDDYKSNEILGEIGILF